MQAYDSTMNHSAAIMVLDEIPSEEDIEDLVYMHLDSLDDDELEASTDILYTAPDWMSICEQDQINAHLRDGSKCVLVVYVTVISESDDD